PQAADAGCSAPPRLALAQGLLVARRLLGADEAVAVGVDAAEQLVTTQELAARDVAVAVAVHLLEPHRASARAGRTVRLHAQYFQEGERVGAAAAGALLQGEQVTVRDVRLADRAAAGDLVHQPRHLLEFAEAQPAVAVGVEQLEEAAAAVGE